MGETIAVAPAGYAGGFTSSSAAGGQESRVPPFEIAAVAGGEDGGDPVQVIVQQFAGRAANLCVERPHLAVDDLPGGYSRAELLLSAATVIAAELQYQLLAHAAGTAAFDPGSAPAATLRRLIAPKVVEPTAAPWTETEVPLVVVRGTQPFKRPAGAVLVISASSDVALIGSLVRAGWLAAGRLEP